MAYSQNDGTIFKNNFGIHEMRSYMSLTFTFTSGHAN